MNERPAKCVSSKRARNFRGLRVFLLNCAWRTARKEKSAKYLMDSLRLRAVSFTQKSARKNAKKNVTHKRAVAWVVRFRAICEAATRR